MGIKMKIHNIKSISEFTFEIPTSKGLYALTGEKVDCKSNFQFARLTSGFPKVLQD